MSATEPVHERRRRFIIQKLLTNRELPLAEIHAQFEGTAPQSIKDDIEHLIGLGMPIGKKKIGREVVLVNDSTSQQDIKHTRYDVSTDEKSLLAELMVGVLCGFNKRNSDSDLKSFPNDFLNCPTVEDIRTQIQNSEKAVSSIFKYSASCDKLMSCLDQLWREQNRLMCIDSGTTTERIVDLMVRLPIPTPESTLSRLTVCTNDAAMFNKLGDPRCPITTIVIGGQKRGRTDAIAGALAENFLRSASLHFGISVVSAASTNLRNMNLGSDSQEEANLKSIIFEKSSLRIVCIDNSKFTQNPMRAVFPFASIAPEQIDLIITNYPKKLSDEQRNGLLEHEVRGIDRATEEFPKHVASIMRRGVPILIAEWPDRKDVAEMYSNMAF